MARRRRLAQTSKGAPAWLLTYSDMFTLILAFFVMLYAMSAPDIERFRLIAEAMSVKAATQVIELEIELEIEPEVESEIFLQITTVEGVTEVQQIEAEEIEVLTDAERENLDRQRVASEELNRMASDFLTYFGQNNLAGDIDVLVTNEYIILTFGDGVLFDSGRAELKPNAIEILDHVAQELDMHPRNEIRIEGHTDNVPINAPPMFLNNMWLSAARAITVRDYFTDVKLLTPGRISVEGKGEYSPVASNDTPEGRAKNRRVEIKIISTLFSADRQDNF